jgi:hypothetical protein
MADALPHHLTDVSRLNRYLLNPYTLLPTISLSTSAFDNMLVLLAVMFAAEGTMIGAPLSNRLLTRVQAMLAEPAFLLWRLLPILLFHPYCCCSRLSFCCSASRHLNWHHPSFTLYTHASKHSGHPPGSMWEYLCCIWEFWHCSLQQPRETLHSAG